MENKKILTDYLIEKMEDVLDLDHDNGKYTMQQQIFEKDKDIICNLFLPFNIDGKTIVDYSESANEILKKDNYRHYIRFNPIKYKSHLCLLEEALIDFGKNIDADLDSCVIKEDGLFYGKVLMTFEDGSKELFMETTKGYKKENEALLKVILLALTDYEEE